MRTARSPSPPPRRRRIPSEAPDCQVDSLAAASALFGRPTSARPVLAALPRALCRHQSAAAAAATWWCLLLRLPALPSPLPPLLLPAFEKQKPADNASTSSCLLLSSRVPSASRCDLERTGVQNRRPISLRDAACLHPCSSSGDGARDAHGFLLRSRRQLSFANTRVAAGITAARYARIPKQECGESGHRP